MKRIKTGGQNVQEVPSEVSVFEKGPNPLLNYAILTELMSYLPVPDLRRCRLVNSAWKSGATPYLKKNSWLKSSRIRTIVCAYRGGRVVVEYGPYKYLLGGLSFSENNPNRDRKLTELGLFGIQNFCVHLPPFLQSSLAKVILLIFFEEYGANFRNVSFEISIESLEFLGTLLACLPNLVSLSINFEENFVHTTVWEAWPSTPPGGMPSIKRICIKNGEYTGFPEVRGSIVANNHYKFLKRLLQIASNLETLKFEQPLRIKMPNWNDDYDDYYEHTENLYLRLLKDEGKTLCPKLKDLNWHEDDRFSPWDMQLMLQLDVKFRQLSLPTFISAYANTVDFLLQLLERHQSSLEVFKLRMSLEINEDKNSSISFQFPCFPKLRKLLIEQIELDCYDKYGIGAFDPVDYATQFPVLKDLSLFYYSSEFVRNQRFDGRAAFYNQFFPDNEQVCHTLQRLTVEVPHPDPRRKKSWNLSNYQQLNWRLELMFPNVHNHEEVKACRAMKSIKLETFVVNGIPEPVGLLAP